MKVKAFCSPHWSVLQEHARSLWGDAKSNGDTPILFVPTTAMRSYWLSVLNELAKGISGDSVSVLDFFAYRLASSCTGKLARLAQHVEQKLAAVYARSKLNLTSEWLQTGIVDSFLDTVEELELHDLSPEAVQGIFPNDRAIQNLTEWWKAWKEALHEQSLWSVGDALKVATEFLREGKISPPSARTVLVYGFTAFTSARWDFLKAFLTRMDKGDLTVHFFISTNLDNPNAYGYTEPLVNRLKEELKAEVETLPANLPDELKSLPNFLFRSGPSKEGHELTDRVIYIGASGEEQEVETVVRLLAHWRRIGCLNRFGDVLLVAHSLEPYIPALQSIRTRYGISFTVLGEKTKRHEWLTNLLWAIWEARRSNWRGEALWQLLPSPYLCDPADPQKPLLTEDKHCALISLVRQSLFESGSEKWLEFLKEKFDGESFFHSVKEFIAAVDKLPAKATAKEHASKWKQVLKFVRPLDERDEKTLNRLRGQLNILGSWSTELSGEEFLEFLVEACAGDEREFVDSIWVASAKDSRGLVAPVVVLLGMSDGFFPPPPPTFELLTDQHRETLTGELKLTSSLRFRRRPKCFEFATSFAQEQKMLFAEMLGIATERLVLSHPRTDPEGKPIARSLFLDEVENALKSAGYIWFREERDLADVVLPEAKSETSLLPPGTNQAINSHEATVTATFYAFTGRHPLSEVDKSFVSANLKDKATRERLLSEWKRWTQPQGGKWDGKMLKIDIQSLLKRWEEQGLWLTALEDYGHCPYRFFAKHILNLKRPQEVTYTVDPATLGELWHRIIAKFLKLVIQSGEFPPEEAFRQIAGEVLKNFAQEKKIPQQVKELLRAQIEVVLPLIWKAEKLQAENWTPTMVEREFKVPATAFGDLPEELTGLNLVMRIDRIDKNKGDEYRVADYKTGSTPSQKDIENGTALQLPLYAFAFQQEFKIISLALFLKLLSFTGNGDYNTACRLAVRVKSKRSLPLQKAISIAKEHALRYLVQIAQANFTVSPFEFDSSCRRCDFKPLCRHQRLRLKERRQEREGEGEEGE
ncbi:MAG: PD-(D/E)XK nuclease family protein [Candidatus Fervidibacter sp.]|uniref:PD-(D/E)XK nuclease family protein n=1 Tax=Candidatus Fervidibacter sp. TaxID=3100871 RepID=UPI00404A76EA